MDNGEFINRIVVGGMAGVFFPLGIYIFRKIMHKPNELMLNKNIRKSTLKVVGRDNYAHELTDKDIDDKINEEYVRDRNIIRDLHMNGILSDAEYVGKLETLGEVRDQKIEVLKESAKSKARQRNCDKLKDMINDKLVARKMQLDRALSSCVISEMEYMQKIEEFKSRIERDVDEICSFGFYEIVGSRSLSLMEMKKIISLKSGYGENNDFFILKNRFDQNIGLYSKEECLKLMSDNKGDCFSVIID